MRRETRLSGLHYTTRTLPRSMATTPTTPFCTVTPINVTEPVSRMVKNRPPWCRSSTVLLAPAPIMVMCLLLLTVTSLDQSKVPLPTWSVAPSGAWSTHVAKASDAQHCPKLVAISSSPHVISAHVFDVAASTLDACPAAQVWQVSAPVASCHCPAGHA